MVEEKEQKEEEEGRVREGAFYVLFTWVWLWL
jgi:hypothetical protein